MGQLVSNHVCGNAFYLQRRIRLHQKNHGTVSHQPRMFHRITRVWDGNFIEFFVWIRYAEIFLEQIDDLRRGISRILRFRGMTLGYNDPDLRVFSASVTFVYNFHGPNRHSNQVTGKWFCLGKRDRFHAVTSRRLVQHRSVRERAITVRYCERDLPWHFKSRLVEARKGAPCGYVFELGIDIPMTAVLDLENTGHILAADFAFIFDVQHGRTSADGVIKREAGKVFRFGYHADRDCLATAREGGIFYCQLLGVEPEDRSGLFEIQSNLDLASESILVGNQGQMDFIAFRARACG